MASRTGYEYDVFLSYTTEFPFGEWVHEYFRPLFEGYLHNALGQRPKIFVDRENISAGESWPKSLAKALADSRCLVAIWSPSYFDSHWCLKECAVMIYRETQLNYRTINNPSGLILPVTVYDGDRFPSFAKEVQHLDCRDFARVGPGFKNTERYIQFQDQMINWTGEVAQAIHNAPPWHSEWREKEWIDVACRLLSTISTNLPFHLPVLE